MINYVNDNLQNLYYFINHQIFLILPYHLKFINYYLLVIKPNNYSIVQFDQIKVFFTYLILIS